MSTSTRRQSEPVIEVKPLWRRRWVWIATAIALLTVVAVVIAVGILLKRQGPAKSATAVPVLSVSVQPAKVAQVPHALEVAGTVAARDPLTIGAEPSGLRIDSVLVEEGQLVKRGQPLATLDSSVLRAQLQAAQARYAGSQAAATKSLQPNRQEEILAFRAAHSAALADVENRRSLVAQSEATAQQATESAKRYTQLYRAGGVSLEEAEQHEATARSSRAALAAAKQTLQSAEFAASQAQQRMQQALAGGRREDIASAQAVAQENAAVIAQLRAQIEQTIIRAPDSGLVVKRDAHIGDISTPGKSLFQMVRQGILELRAQVTQKDLAAIKPGASAVISDGTRTTGGVVTDITPAVDPTTRLGIVRIRINNAGGFLPGMFSHARLTMGTRTALVVPSTAIQGEPNNYYVFVVDSTNRAHRRPVSVTNRTAQVAEVQSGLAPGEQLVVAGAGFLNDGDLVRISL